MQWRENHRNRVDGGPAPPIKPPFRERPPLHARHRLAPARVLVRAVGRDVLLHRGGGPEVPPFTLVLVRVAIAALALVPLVYLSGYDCRRARRLGALHGSGHHQQRHSVYADGVRPAAHCQRARRRSQRHHAAVHADRGARAGRRKAGDKQARGRTARCGGVGILVGTGRLGANTSSVIGMLCILGGTVSYALSALWMRRLRHIPPLVSSAAQLACSTVSCCQSRRCWIAFGCYPFPAPPPCSPSSARAVFDRARLHRVLPDQRHAQGRATSCSSLC